MSFGLETLSPKGQRLLNRVNKKERIKKIISKAKELGFNNINIDLIYAFPGETKEDLKKDLDFIISLDIEHISTYSLIIEEHTILFNLLRGSWSNRFDNFSYFFLNKLLK